MSVFRTTMLPQIHEIPLVRPAISLAFGIIITDVVQLNSPPFFLLAISLVGYLFIRYTSKSVHTPVILGILLWLNCALIGSTLLVIQKQELVIPEFASIRGNIRINHLTKNKRSISSFEGSMLLVADSGNQVYQLNATYFDTLLFDCTEGDIVFIEGEILPFKNPLNPYEFDAKSHNFKKGISAQLMIDSIQYIKSDPHWLDKMKQTGRVHIENGLVAVDNPNVRALLIAMITGDKSDLSPSIKSDFSSAGIMHLLAVSGLHVGLVGWLPLLLLQRCGQMFWLKTTTGIVGLLIVWIFAIFTGLAPSAFRAALMFTLVAVAIYFQLRTSSLNMLSAAAITVLVSDPSSLFSIGFQLSFAAVAGISMASSTLQNWFYTPYNWLNKIIGSANVSIAAQAATTPITMFHFGVFPLYFLPANLIAVPLGTLLMYLILAMLIPDPTGVVHEIIGFTANQLGMLLLKISHIIAILPGSQLFVNDWSILNSALLVIGFLLILSVSKETFWRPATAALVILIGLTFERNQSNEHIVLFSDKRKSIGICTDQKAIILSESKKLPFELQGWASRNQAAFVSLHTDTLLTKDKFVFARVGNQIFCNFIAVCNPDHRQKKYPVTVCGDTSGCFVVATKLMSDSVTWNPTKGAYSLGSN